MKLELKNGQVLEGTPEECRTFLSKWLYSENATNTNIKKYYQKKSKKNKVCVICGEALTSNRSVLCGKSQCKKARLAAVASRNYYKHQAKNQQERREYYYRKKALKLGVPFRVPVLQS